MRILVSHPKRLLSVSILFLLIGLAYVSTSLFKLLHGDVSINLSVFHLFAGVLLLRLHPLGWRAGILCSWIDLLLTTLAALQLVLVDRTITGYASHTLIDPDIRWPTILFLLMEYGLAWWSNRVLNMPDIRQLYGFTSSTPTPALRLVRRGLFLALISSLSIIAALPLIQRESNAQLSVQVTGQPQTVIDSRCSYEISPFLSRFAATKGKGMTADEAVDLTGVITTRDTPVTLSVTATALMCVIQPPKGSPITAEVFQDGRHVGTYPSGAVPITIFYRVVR